mmetsp:Transcript_8837/g.16041  ORF Transcript_8837/g.16041 Transcript_8837/m.16041 type:complete len:314 (+) Transcript_8837:277-1218(+)
MNSKQRTSNSNPVKINFFRPSPSRSRRSDAGRVTGRPSLNSVGSMMRRVRSRMKPRGEEEGEVEVLQPRAPPFQSPLPPVTAPSSAPNNSTNTPPSTSLEEEEISECPVCFEAVTKDTQILCSNTHKMCVSCMRMLVKDNVPANSATIPHVGSCDGKIEACRCTGFGFRCPVCREECVMEPQHVRATIKGSWSNSKTSTPLPPLNPPPKSSLHPRRYTDKGYTTDCVSCRSAGVLTPSVNAKGDLLGLCCSSGHTLCVPCSRKLGDATKCNSVKCKGIKCKQFGMGYECPECNVKHIIGRRHMHVLLRGGWSK